MRLKSFVLDEIILISELIIGWWNFGINCIVCIYFLFRVVCLRTSKILVWGYLMSRKYTRFTLYFRTISWEFSCAFVSFYLVFCVLVFQVCFGEKVQIMEVLGLKRRVQPKPELDELNNDPRCQESKFPRLEDEFDAKKPSKPSQRGQGLKSQCFEVPRQGCARGVTETRPQPRYRVNAPEMRQDKCRAK